MSHFYDSRCEKNIQITFEEGGVALPHSHQAIFGVFNLKKGFPYVLTLIKVKCMFFLNQN